MWQFSWKSEKKIFDLFLKTFLTNWGKNEDEKGKKWFQFLNYIHIRTKLYMWQFLWKSYKKFFDPSCKIFLLNWGKNEDEDQKFWKNEFDFWIFHMKISLYGIFHKNLRKKSFFKIFTWKGHTRTEVSKGLLQA